MTKREKTFKGPLFVVGMSRSGTTLLLEVLNRNPKVSIPSSESLFIPYIIQNYRDKTFPLNQKLAQEIWFIVKYSRFYDILDEKGLVFQDPDLDKILKSLSLAEMIEFLMRFFTVRTDKKNDFIWGDKSPPYLQNISLLKDFFPSARFIHIIRDPRDRALSAHKAWGANLYFTAERWRESIKTGRHSGQQLGNDYLEVFYKKFIAAPAKEIQRLCNFLDIPFNECMLELTKPIEAHAEIDAETRQTTRIVPNNTKKYLRELSPGQVKKIDEIVFPVAKEIGYYPIHQGTKHVPLTRIPKIYYSLGDRFNTIVWHIRRYGLKKGLRYMLWRNRVALR